MGLVTDLTTSFDPAVRARGREYFQSGAVEVVRVGPNIVKAEVSGSDVYDVQLNLESNKRDVRASCSCPYFEDTGPCKHIWATLLAVEGSFGSGRTRLRLIDDFEDEDFDEYDDDEYDPEPARTRWTPLPAAQPKGNWKTILESLKKELPRPPQENGRYERRTEKQVIFVVDVPVSKQARKLAIEVQTRDLKKNGEWGKPRAETLQEEHFARMNDPTAKTIFELIRGSNRDQGYGYYSSYISGVLRFQLSGPLLDVTLPHLVESQRLFLRRDPKLRDLEPITPDLETTWSLEIGLRHELSRKRLVLTGHLRNGETTMPLTEPALILPGLVFWNGRMSRLENSESFAWVPVLQQKGPVTVPQSKAKEFIGEVLQMNTWRGLEVPEDLRYAEVSVPPKPQVVVKQNPEPFYRDQGLVIDLSFDYDGQVVPLKPASRGVLDAEGNRFLLRDEVAEQRAVNELKRLGAQETWGYKGPGLTVVVSRLPNMVRQLVSAGWGVKAEGKLYRQPGAFTLAVSSHLDWFDLSASADFEGKQVPLPRLLEALRKGDSTVVLDDGSVGMLPEEWLKKYGLFAQMGTVEGDVVRFRRTQVGVLDALLASRPEVEFDQQFRKAREELRKFHGVAPVDAPATFQGELREYQREGLGWMQFLRKFGFGGCLADDMGLGKTVQVLSLLAGRRVGPTLIVVPKSLIFNWKSEAARFAPKLKVLDHTGLLRDRTCASFKDQDIILTTYGTLRMDAATISEFPFDTCILDESQAAKNAETETAKAVRLIQADHRLALSGTPVENHLGELWTLFDFLNPGMLGRVGLFGKGAGTARILDEETRNLLAQAVRPFILRRTKSQVAKDLPEKTEQTIFCDLEPEQRLLYDELREHYRQSLLSRVDDLGLKRSKIQVLEALLRLRQAACHPGLIDKKRSAETSAKLEVLFPQLQELAQEGAKALVFSQFTSLLSIVRSRLDEMGIPYEYLDGRTRDREARVERFQTDPDCKLFLVSLKAGGVGLNLTAAEYVFLLDPWWNPAVEAQAIDRSHRIGQTKPVFAYRLIAKNTVEEKVLELQKSKRELADAILGGEGRVLADLKREDLELLLS